MHIVFNLIWIRQLAPSVAELYGPGRTVIIYTVGSIAGFALSAFAGRYLSFLPILHGAPFTIGASAAIFGLLGGLVYYGQRTGSSVVHSQALMYAGFMFIFGLISPGVDNFAHLGGFAGGWLIAVALDPLKPERVDHMMIALGCLVASIASILASIIIPTGIGQ